MALRLVLAFLAVLYGVQLGVLAGVLGPYDYNHLAGYYELGLRFWEQGGGWPEFNPYLCGGRTLGADPQIPVFHPLLLSVALLGPVWTLKWELLVQVSLGVFGLWHWLTRWKVEPAGRAWGCVLFLAGGFTVARVMVGHVTLGFYLFAPLYFLLSYRLSEKRIRFSDAGAFALLCAYGCLYKPNFLIYFLPPLLVEAALRAWLSRSARPLFVFAGAGAIAGLTSAVSLLPAADYFAAFPRTSDAAPKHVPLYALIANLVMPLKAIPAAWYGSPFMQRHEYNVFLGPVALWFALRGLSHRWPDAAEKNALLGYGLFSAWLGLGFDGTFSTGNAFSWFHAIWPGFESVRVPVRFWHGVFLAALVFSAVGFSWPRSRLKRTVVVALGLLPLVLSAGVNLSKIYRHSSGSQFATSRAFPSTIEQVHVDADFPFRDLRQGRSVLDCVLNLEALQAPALQVGNLLATSDDVTARWKGWNRVEVAGRSSRAKFNFNHHPYWSWEGTPAQLTSRPGEPLRVAGSMPLDGVLVFRQPRVREGFWISVAAVALLAWALLFLYRRKRRPWRVGLTGGIGSGKTTFGRLLAERGWWIVDLDVLARELTDSDPGVHREIRRIFGDGVFDGDALNRRALREAVFSDRDKRRQLESTLHPLLLGAYRQRCKEAAKEGVPAVVCEAALLVETGHHRSMDYLVTLSAPESLRRERIAARDGLPTPLIDSILSAQASDVDKIAVADSVVVNDGQASHLRQQADDLVSRLKSFAR